MTETRRPFLPDWELPPAPTEFIQSIPAPNQLVDDRPKRRGRKPTHKRKRDWESAHPAHTFVGVPLELREAICNIAEQYRNEHGMVGGVDAVTRELLRYSLLEYSEGRLNLGVAPRTGNSTLISGYGWGTDVKTIPPRKPKQKKPKAPTATYRLPTEQVAAMRNMILREEEKAAPAVVHLTLGQLFTRLLTHALQAYIEGRWTLYATPILTVQGLKGEAA